MSTPYERLLTEAIPTRPAPAPQTPRPTPAGHQWTQAEQDAHWDELRRAVRAPREERPARLRLITHTAA